MSVALGTPATLRVRQLAVAASRPALLVGALVTWELLARTVFAGRFAVAAPTAIIAEISDRPTFYLRNLVATSTNAAWGFLWGNATAVAAAAIAATGPVTRRVVVSVALTVYCLPLVALAPILRVVLGPGDVVSITLAALAVFFTTLVAALLGFTSAPTGPLDVVAAFGRGRLAAFWFVRARAAVPALVAGLQIAGPAAFLGALVGEFTGAERGFGLLTIQALRTLETDQVWAVALVATTVSSAAYLGLGWLGRRWCSWAATVDLAAPATGRPDGPLSRVLTLLAAIAVVLVGWVAFLAVFDVNPYFAKGPVDVWRSLVTDVDAPALRSDVFGALGSTLGTTALGFFAGMVGALVAAALIVMVPVTRPVLIPTAVALRAVPIVATTPLVILVAGRGVLASVLIVAIMTFFPTLVNCAAAMERAPGQVIDVLRVYNASQWADFVIARLPASVPALLASARIAVPASLLGATVAEWLATGRGLGNLMVVASGTARYDVLWACVVVLTSVAVCAHAAISVLERWVLARVAPEQLR